MAAIYEASPIHCFYVMDVLSAALQGCVDLIPPSSIGTHPSLLFVTYRKGKHAEFEDNSLRGCKGTTGHPQPLVSLLRKFALNAAFEDTRFDPITLDELPLLSCGVSLLHSFEECAHHLDWIVGTHGISIDFQVFDSKGTTVKFQGGAIFLPSVAPSMGWDKETTLEHLIRKAGYKGNIDYSRMRFNTIRHQSSSTHVTYAQWRKYCEQKQASKSAN